MVPVRGTNMRYIYVLGSNSSQLVDDRSHLIIDEVLLYNGNKTMPALRVACPSLGAGNEARPQRRILLTVRGLLLELDKYYKQAPYR